MTIKSLQSTSLTNNVFYRSMLAGNDAYFPEFESDDFLEEVVLTSSASSVTFSGLDAYSDYKHLQVRVTGQQSFTGFPYQFTRFRINNDTGSNYSHHTLSGDGSSVTSSAGSSTNYIQMLPLPGSQDANVYGALAIDILDFSSVSRNTTVRALGGGYFAGNQKFIGLSSGSHYSTSAMTSFTHYIDAGVNWTAGSRFSLYGSKG
jgi:hypothetical protein